MTYFFSPINLIIPKIHADFSAVKKFVIRGRWNKNWRMCSKEKNCEVYKCRETPVWVSVFRLWLPTGVSLLDISIKFFWFKHGTDPSGSITKGAPYRRDAFSRLWYCVGFQLKSDSYCLFKICFIAFCALR